MTIVRIWIPLSFDTRSASCRRSSRAASIDGPLRAMVLPKLFGSRKAHPHDHVNTVTRAQLGHVPLTELRSNRRPRLIVARQLDLDGYTDRIPRHRPAGRHLHQDVELGSGLASA